MVDYLARGEKINTAYYCILLRKIKEKHPKLLRKDVLFHQDNARVHTSVESMAHIRDNGFELLPHQAYSPDLAPSDFQLFPNLKKHLGGQKFSSNEEVEYAVSRYFADLEISFFKTGIEALENRWKKCIDLDGDYVEK
jgi:[histone H3]-lysine36 N-dimethyltransferase SETMAR